MVAQLRALFILAWALVQTTWRRLFGPGPRGLALFQANFAGDRLVPLTEPERASLARFGGCFACGRCDAGDGPRIGASAGGYPGTMALVLASTRSLPDLDAASAALAWISDDDLVAKERACPAGVPIAAIARFARAKGAELAPR